MSAADLKLRQRLEQERDALVHQAEELEAERRALVEDPEVAEMRSDEDAESAGLAAEREKDLSLSANAADLLAKVERAIDKLQMGTYGTCERCHKPITKARLNALPYAALCVSCQQAEERLLI